MSKPIYRVMIEYGYRKKDSNRQYKYKLIDTFVNTDDAELISKDAELKSKIIRKLKVGKKEMDIIYKNIYIEGQYGNTNH